MITGTIYRPVPIDHWNVFSCFVFFLTIMTVSLSLNLDFPVIIFEYYVCRVILSCCIFEYHFYEFTQNNYFFLCVICFFGLVFQLVFVLSSRRIQMRQKLIITLYTVYWVEHNVWMTTEKNHPAITLHFILQLTICKAAW